MDLQIINLSNPLWLETLEKLRHDIYHLPKYLDLESKRTKTTPEAFLIVDSEKIFFMPYLLRKCDDVLAQECTTQEIFDIVSPYGYCGILLSETAASTLGFPDFGIDQLKYVLREKGVCSAFLRLHPILNHNFNAIFKPGTFIANGETVSVDLTLSESQIWARTRKGHQSTINKCKRIGFTARIVPFEQYMNEFIAIYEETMSRVEANRSYYFGYDYFTQLLDLYEKLHLCIVELEEQIACACLFFECCGIVQAHLGGTRTQFLNQSPFSLLLDHVRLWAKERGNEFLHIGGGVGGSKDNLYTFKAGFSKQRHDFLTLRQIIDKDKYFHLVDLRAKYLNTEAEKLLKTDFFPAYRSAG